MKGANWQKRSTIDRMRIRRFLPVTLLVIFGAAGAFALAGLLFRAGAPPQETLLAIGAPPTLVTPDWTPAALAPPLPLEVVRYLEAGQPVYGPAPLQVLGEGAIPVGAYLPQSGGQMFVLPTATPTPSRTPRPSATPTPTATLPPSITPSATPTPLPPTLTPSPTPTSELVATIQAFGTQVAANAPVFTGIDCAPIGRPVAGLLTQRYHGRHSGIDIGVPSGTPVLATHSGTVVWADWNVFGYGNLVILQSGRFITYYAHNTRFNVRQGDVIERGAIIAFSGSTGNSSGPHVHYETRLDDIPSDPLTFEVPGYVGC